MHRLSLAEIRSLLYILRHTYGFQKPQDAISLSQFLNGTGALDHGAGIRRVHLLRALKRLEEKGFITRLRQITPSGRCLPTLYAPSLSRHQATFRSPSLLDQDTKRSQGQATQRNPSEGLPKVASQNKEIHLYTKGDGTIPTAASACAEGAAEPPSPGEEPRAPTFESQSLQRRWERIQAWFNHKHPPEQLTPYERRLVGQQMEEAARDPDFEPPPLDFKPPTSDEALDKMGNQRHSPPPNR